MFEESVTHLRALGASAGELFDQVIGDERGDASYDDLSEVLVAVRAARNAVEAVELAALAQLGRREDVVTKDGPQVRVRPLGAVDQFAPSFAAMVMGTSTAVAERQMALGARLVSRLPGTLRLMASGTLDLGRVSRVDRATDGLSAEACHDVEAQVLDRLPRLEPSRVGSEVRRVADRVAPSERRAAVELERARRDVDISPGPDGTTHWWAQLPSETSAAMWAAVTERARVLRGHDSSLTAGQARADALSDLVLGQASVTTSVTLGMPVIETPAALHVPPAEPGDAFFMVGAPAVVGGVECWVSGVEIPKVGYIPAQAVAQVMGGPDLRVGRALLEAETGVLRETRSDAYRPPRRLREFIELRDGTCRMFGCTRPAVYADIDHAVPWPRGETTPAGLAGLCRRHHRTKQQPGWGYRLDPDGVVTWTSPTGVSRQTYPPALVLEQPTQPHEQVKLPPPHSPPASIDVEPCPPPPF